MNAEKQKEFDGIFNPNAVAIIGATQTDDFTNAMMRTKIKDNLFLVNPSRKEIHGKRCYDSILDIEDTIDYVVLAVPAKVLPKVLNECIEKGVKTAHAFTAGFSETGIEERIELENEVKEIIKDRIRLIGPNCMGIYCPKSGLAFSPNAPSEEGTVGVISQSGTFAGLFATWGDIRNLKVSKAVSFGNAIDLDCPDFLEYFANDPETEIIALYMEGSKNGQRLKSAMAEASRKKPVIVLKGGVTEHGSRAASSHTGSLAGSPDIWSALFKQTGVIQVETFDDLANTVLAVTRSTPPSGKGVSMITSTGGFSVIETDVCLKVGLEVPQFTDETLKELRRMVPAAGTAIRNPLDAWPLYYNISEESETIDDAIKLVASDKNIHSLLLHFDEVSYFISVFGDALKDHLKGLIKLMLDGCEYARNELGKPVVVCVEMDPYSEDEADRMYHLMVKNAFEEKQFPVYPTLEASIKTMFNLYRYGTRFDNE
jgi:acetyltransferase